MLAKIIIHFVGIKGVGMTALAILLKEAGNIITGSDIGDQFITDSTLDHAGITYYSQFKKEHVNNANLVIYSGAHNGIRNIEVESAIEKGIETISFAKACGMIMDQKIIKRKLRGISVAGTHGKTTTSAMIATMLKENNLDPSYLIGTSVIPSLGNPGHFGNGNYIVVEADEYATDPAGDIRPKFLWHKPEIAVVNNIEHDHPDIFPTQESFTDAFRNFLVTLPEYATVIINGDDTESQKLLSEIKVKKITFGEGERNDVVISDVKSNLQNTSFKLRVNDSDLGYFTLNVAGVHNCFNATAAAIVGLEIGLNTEQVRVGLSNFKGSKRRLEFLGQLENGAIIIDDYAHHPTEIKKSLRTLRDLYPGKIITCLFQPHTYSRTKALFAEFTKAFTDADKVILTDIFASARENLDPTVSSQKLADEARKDHKNVIFLPKLADVVKYLNENQPQANEVFVTMGAGDVYKVAEQFKYEAGNY